MKLRDEWCKERGYVIPDEEVSYETDDQFVLKNGMGVIRSTETFWRNIQDPLKFITEDINDKAEKETL